MVGVVTSLRLECFVHARLLVCADVVAGGLTRREVRAGLAPAARFDTTHGDRQRGLRGHEHVRVEDAVLLGAHEFLAVHQEHAVIQRVLDAQVRHAAGVADFRDFDRVERLVLQQLVAGLIG